MDTDGAIRVLLVGGSDAATQGVSGVLSGCAGVEVVGEVDSRVEAVVAARDLSPDAVLMLADSLASGMDGVDALRAIAETRPGARVVIITRNITRYLVPAVKAGAAGILSPEATLEELLPAICGTHRWTTCSLSPMQ